MPSRNHSRVAQKLGVLLSRFSEHVDVFQQLSLNLNGFKAIPDLSVFQVGKLPFDMVSDENEVTEPPSLIIEILSPMQNMQPLVNKVRDLIDHGVTTGWIVLPMSNVIVVYQKDMPPKPVVEGILRDAASGVEIEVAAVFRR